MKALIEKIKKIAEKETHSHPEFNACDASGGNFDDAYSMGCDDGEIFLARELVSMLDEIPNLK